MKMNLILNVNNRYRKIIVVLLIVFISFFCLINKIWASSCTSRTHLGQTYCEENFKCGTACARPDLPNLEDVEGGYDYIVQVGVDTRGQKLYRQNSQRRIFCARHSITSPAYGDGGDYKMYYTCDYSYNFENNNDFLKAAIGYVISQYTSGTDDDYFKAQTVIHKLLENYNGQASVSGEDTTLYNAAVTSGNNYINGESGTYYLAKVYKCGEKKQHIVDGYNTVDRYKVIYHGNGGSTLEDQTIVTDNLKYGDYYSVKGSDLFNRTNHTFLGWTTKSDGTDDGHNWTGWSGTWEFTNNHDYWGIKDNELHLYARWLLNSYEVIYHGNGGSTLEGQTIVTDNLKEGDYYSVKGSDLFNRTNHTFLGWTTDQNGEVDDGYNWTGWSGNWVYTNGQYGISNNKLELYARWEDSCVYEFKNKYNGNPTPIDRLQLYKKYHIGGLYSESRRNLLNYKITDPIEACSGYKPIYDSSTECLYSNQAFSIKEKKQNNNYESHRFDVTDISGYNDTISINGSIGYCLTKFELSKEDNVEYNENYILNGKVNLNLLSSTKAGRMVFNIGKDDILLKGTFRKICYIENKNGMYGNGCQNLTVNNFIEVNDYVSNIKLDDKVLPFIKDEPRSTKARNAGLFGDVCLLEDWATVTYKSNPVYAEVITGNSEGCFDNESNLKDSCRVIGYGVASKFKDANSQTIQPSFNFEITTGTKNIFDFNSNIDCLYNVEPEIINYKNSDKGKIDLEFRIIDTKTPFNRKTKSNWSDGTDNSPTNNKVTQYIIAGNNSYNRTGQGSLYTNQTDGTKRIILTPDIVQKIRDYNKLNSYNDYTIYTKEENGTKRTSTSFFDYIGLTKIE